MSCLCGCPRPLPPGHEFFATNDCVEVWAAANKKPPRKVATVLPFPLRTVEG